MRADERCDRCSAQAYVETHHSGNPLYWCIHHFEQYKFWLAQAVYRDHREQLSRTALIP